MSLAKCPNSRITQGKNDPTPCPESRHVGSKQKSNADGSAFKQSLNPKRRINNKMVDIKKKEFVIPRKKKQAKELLQTHSFDSRETKELLRAVQVTLRDPNFWPSYKFERIEFVNNEKLARKYGDKKQSLRLESMRTNRELEDKFAFLYTTSRTEAKSICEHGLSTGHSSLTSLGDPNLGVYLCRFADIIYKRPLVNEDSGYLLVFRVVKGKVRFIGGSNPELQPTPHHDCHVSKSLTTLSSKAQHSDVFESSQLYFYEIDENSEHFHVKHPRQLLPYAVLSFTIVNSDKQKTKPDDKLETKKTHIRGHEFPSSSEENNLCSPNRIEYKEDLISNANVSWSGILGINKKPLAYVDFLSYSRKKHPLPIHVDHINITWKVSHKDLRSVLRCPVFTNGKPASSGVCVELGNSKKIIYYEVRPVNQVKEKFNELVSHFVDTKMAGIIEYFDGAIYLYLIPTSSLTHNIGITDKKSPLALHALVQVRHAQRLLNTQVSNEDTNKEDVGIDDTLNEAVIRSRVQEIFKKKFDSKLSHRKTKISKIASLMSKRIYLGDNVEGNLERASDVKKKSSDVGSTLPSKGCSHKKKQIEYQRDAQKWVQHDFISATKEKNSSSEQSDSVRVTNTENSRSKWSEEKILDRGCSPETQVVSFSDDKHGQKDEQNLSSSTSTAEKSSTEQQELASAPKYSSKNKFDNTRGSDVTSMDSTTPFHSPLQNFKSEIDFSFVQKLIKEFQNVDKEKSALKQKRSFETVDQILQGPSSLSAQDAHLHEAASYPYSVVPLSPPPIPPPPPPPLPPPPPPPVGPFFMPLSPPCAVVNKNNLNTISSEPSPAVLDAASSVSLATSPVSPPTVKRQEMPIPGFEPPGSPAFQLMKEKVSFLNQSICTNATFFKDSNISNKSVATWNQLHSTSSVRYSPTSSTPFSSTESHTSLGNDRALHQEIPPGYRKLPQSMDVSPKTNSNMTVVDKYHHSEAENATPNECDKPDYNNVVIKRPLTMAEKNSSQAIREIHKILFQNRDVLSTSSEDENNVRESPAIDHGSLHTVISRTDRLEDSCIKPSLQKPGDEDTCLMAQNSSNKAKEYTTEESEDEFCVSKDIGSVTEKMHPKEKDDKTGKKAVCNNQPFKKSLQDSLRTPNKQSLDSDSSSPITPELKSGLDLVNSLISGHKRGHQSSPLLKAETSHRIENDIRESSDYGKGPEECSKETTTRKEKFDGESKKILSSRKRKVTIKRSDSSSHENKWEGIISEISYAEPSLDSENLQNFERISPRHKVVILPGNKDTCEVSNQTAMGYRHDGGTHSDGVDDDWERDRKRRKLDEDQAKEMQEPLLQDHRSDSDSEMSISPLNSPTNFEYAVTNNDPTSRYQYVKTIPADGSSLEVTITRGCTDTDTINPDCHAPEPYHDYEHLQKPSSPTEIDIIPTSVIPDSPGTPETAIPSEDFLHANIRYWSLGYTEPVERKAILPKKIDDMRFERIQEDIEDATHRNERGCAQRTPKNIGEHSGYDLSYNDRDNIFYTMDHDDPHKTSSIDEPCTNDYKKLRDLDINTDRYPRHRYNDPRDSELYTSRSPYEDVVSPYSLESVDIEEPVDIVGPYGRYYSSVRVGSYNTHERQSSPLQIHASHYSPERMGTVNNYGRQRSLLDNDNSSRYLLEQSRAVEDKCEQPLSDVEQATSSLLDQREAVDNNYKWIRTFLDNNKQVLQYSLDQREDGNDDYDCQRSRLDNDIQTHWYSQDQRNVVNYEYEEQRSTLDKNDRYSPHQRDEMSDEYGWETSLLNDEEASQYSLDQREGINDEYGWEISPHNDNQACQYSIDRREDTEYGYCRSPIDKDGKILYYSQDQRQGIHDDYHCQRQMLQSDSEAFQYSPERRASMDGEYECQGSPLNGSQTPQFSLVQGGEVHVEYGSQRSLLNDNQARYSPKRRQITGDRNTRESLSPLRISSHSQYSPSRKEEPDDVYRHRLSPDHSIDAEDVYSSKSCSPLQISGGMSLYSPYRRSVIDDYYETGKHDNEPIQSLPICKYRKKYLNDNKDFTVSDEEVIDPHCRGYLHDVNVHNNKEQQDHHSENQKKSSDHVESNYSSKKDMLECDSLRTPEYCEQHKYWEDVVEKNISKTTLELDRAVFDGIRDFPMQLMELEKYFQNVPRISEGKLLFDTDGAAPVVDRNTSFSRDPRLNKGCKAQNNLLTTERLLNNKSVLENVGSSEEQRNSVKGVKRNCVKAGVGSGGADGPGQEDRRKKKAGDHKKVIKPFPKKLSYFYVYNPDNDPECDAVKHYMIKTGAQFLDASNESNLKNLAGELRVLVRRKHRTSVHRIRNLDKLKLCATVKFALFNTVEDVSKKTRAYAAIFQYGGVLIPDDVILRTVEPTYLEAMLRYIAEQNACHQKVFWVMNVRYIAYKKLGSQRPLTWRDAFVLDLLKKYRNEGFVNIINKDYVVENLSSVQRYLDTALKQQLELMPMYRHFIVISDLNKQTLEVSWFLNRGIGFMDVKEFLHLFAGEARMQHLLSVSEYTKDACEQYTAEGTTHDIMQYDAIDSPEDEDSTSSVIPATSFISSSGILKASYEGDRDFYRSSPGNVVSCSANYKVVNMKEKRLEILSSINNVKTNLVDKMKAKGYCRKPMKDCGVIQGSILKQRQYERSKSDEPRLRVTPSKLDSHRCYDSAGTLDDSGLPDSKEVQYPRSLYNKRDSNQTNTPHGNKGALPSSKSNPRRERNSNQVETIKNLGSPDCDNRKSPVHWHSALYIDNRAQ